MVLLSSAWAVLAIYYCKWSSVTVRVGAVVAFGAATICAFALLPRLSAILVFGIAVLLVLIWRMSIQPSHDRPWLEDVAVLPRADFEGSRVTVRSVRFFEYRTRDDYTAHYDDRVYDLDALDSVDLFMSYWSGNRRIAHTILSFGFNDGEHLALSVETRKEQGEGYSAIGGLFKNFEIIYVLGDERDLIQLRTNHREERVFLYPTVFNPQESRELLRSALEQVNAIHDHPAFYHAVCGNCTTSLLTLSPTVRQGDMPLDLRMWINGYFDQMLHEMKRLPADESKDLPYEEMRAAHEITEVARACGDDPGFSRRIREGLPEPSDRT